METMSVNDTRREQAIGKKVQLRGWVRTRRDSKGGFSFLEINDGSCFGNVQVVADGKLANYEAEIKKLGTGCSVVPTHASSSSRGTRSWRPIRRTGMPSAPSVERYCRASWYAAVRPMRTSSAASSTVSRSGSSAIRTSVQLGTDRLRADRLRRCHSFVNTSTDSVC